MLLRALFLPLLSTSLYIIHFNIILIWYLLHWEKTAHTFITHYANLGCIVINKDFVVMQYCLGYIFAFMQRFIGIARLYSMQKGRGYSILHKQHSFISKNSATS